jgi:hypothetical protein
MKPEFTSPAGPRLGASSPDQKTLTSNWMKFGAQVNPERAAREFPQHSRHDRSMNSTQLPAEDRHTGHSKIRQANNVVNIALMMLVCDRYHNMMSNGII